MGLLDAIPGLAAFQEQEPAIPQQLGDDEVDRLLREARSLVSSAYPTGALEWIEENRPKIRAYLRDAEREVDAAALARDRERLVRALDIWTRAHDRAFVLFNERPAVLQRQEED